MGRKTDSSMLLPILRGRPYPEGDVVLSLRNASATFRDFYDHERPALTHPITWLRTPDLPPGVFACARSDHQGRQWIQLREVPVPVDKAQGVAHELAHLVLFQSLPFAVADARQAAAVEAAARINTLLHDPLVHLRLLSYGFDPLAEVAALEQATLPTLADQLRDVTTLTEQFYWTMAYAETARVHAIVDRVHPGRTSPLLTVFQRCAPALSRRGQQLVGVIDNLGANTPRTMLLALIAVIKAWSLDAVLKIHVPEPHPRPPRHRNNR